MIAAARLMGDAEVPVLGINYGGLGYLAEFRIEELYSALESILDERTQATLEQLDVPEHALVHRDRHVVFVLREVGLHGRRNRRRRDSARLGGVAQREQFVDGCGFGRFLREAVASRERGDFERADAIDEPIELRAQPRLHARAARRVQEDVDRVVELVPGLFEVAQIKIALALVVNALGFVEDGLDRIRRGGRLCRRLLSGVHRGRRGRRRGRRRADLRPVREDAAAEPCCYRDPNTPTARRC